MPARALMLQGTGSSVGKSLLLAGLARALFRRGLNVRPFKPQNMANNAAVSIEGGEISRAQALQARAAGVAPSVHMNPVLLKPESERGSQIIVHGRVFGKATAREYQWLKPQLLPKVLESFQILAAASDLVLVEGAGSAAEVNLRAHDIANMGFARAAGVPVVLIGDIDRGGVIASLIGTKAVLAEDDAACIKGFIVNRIRGDAALFAEGMRFIAARPQTSGGRYGGAARRTPQKRRQAADCRALAAAYREFRRSRPAALGAGGESLARAARAAAAGGCGSGSALGLQIRAVGFGGFPQRGLGYRSFGVSSARQRVDTGHLRRLANARPHNCGSGRIRRRTGNKRGARLAGYRNGFPPQQAFAGSFGNEHFGRQPRARL